MATIYLITAPDGQKYVGSTKIPLNIRFSNHKSDARLNKCPNMRLYKAMMEQGANNFTIEPLVVVGLDQRYQAEANHIRHQNAQLNKNIPGRDPAEYKRAWRAAHPDLVAGQAQRRRERRDARRAANQPGTGNAFMQELMRLLPEPRP